MKKRKALIVDGSRVIGNAELEGLFN